MIKLALCLEYPLRLRGGVSVLVETLLHGLAPNFALVLVSPDASIEEAGIDPRLCNEHVQWDPVNISKTKSRALADRLVQLGVGIAHFHHGGNYGWGLRCPGQSPIVFTARRGIRVFGTAHSVLNIFAGYCGPQRPWWFKLALLPIAWLGKMQALRQMNAEVAVSEHDLRKLRRWYWPARNRYTRIYHSRLEATAAEGTFEEREKTILCVGHVAERKGQDVLASAFAKVASAHPGWRLMFVGADGGDGCLQNVERITRAHRLEDRLVWLGERRDVGELMRRTGIFVQPSRHEALGLALQEALWCGCPAIGTRAGGIPELIEHQRNGWLVPPDDPAALAAALDRLILDDRERERLARFARSSIVARGMTAARMLADYTELYAPVTRG